MTDRDGVADASSRHAPPSVAGPNEPLWPIVFPLALATLFFWPVTRNFFYADDLLALYEAIHKPLLGFLFDPYGGHVMATRNLVYLFLYHLFGLDPSIYFLVVLLTHLSNVALLFLIVRELTNTHLACFSAALWGSAPIHQAPLGWYQAYGVVLAVAAQLWILHRLVRIRRTDRLSWFELATWGLLLIGAGTSFGTGLAITMSMPGVAWLVLAGTKARRPAVVGLLSIAALVAAAYFGVQRLGDYLHPEAFRLNIVTVALAYWQDVLKLASTMMVHGLTVLLLGPVAHYVSAAGWIEWGLAAGFLTATGAAFAAATADSRRLMLACLLPFVIGYLAIGSGRVIFWAMLGSKLVVQAHYHYTAPLTIAVLAALVIRELIWRWQPSASAASAVLASWFVASAALQFTVGRGVDNHAEARKYAERTLAEIERLVKSQPAEADVFIENRAFPGVGPLVVRNPKAFPGLAGLFAVYHPDQLLAGRRVFFVEDRLYVREHLRDRPFGAMLVAPEAVPAGRILHLPRWFNLLAD